MTLKARTNATPGGQQLEAGTNATPGGQQLNTTMAKSKKSTAREAAKDSPGTWRKVYFTLNNFSRGKRFVAKSFSFPFLFTVGPARKKNCPLNVLIFFVLSVTASDITHLY